MKRYDTRFTYGFVPHRYSDRIQRSTTLDCICPPRPGPDQEKQMLARVNKLVGLWRVMLYALLKVGWCRGPVDSSPEKVARDFQFLRNCPPTWAKVNQRTRCCRIDHFCPFCYSRWVLKIWLLLVQKFPEATNNPLNESPHLMQQQYDLIVRLRSTDLPFTCAPDKIEPTTVKGPRPTAQIENLDLDAVQQRLRMFLKQVPAGRKKVIDSVRDTVGQDISALISTIVVPTAKCWCITTRSIFIIPQGADFPIALCQDCDWYERLERPSHSKLHKTISKLLAYPRALLRADPRLVATMLRARNGIHLNAKYGGFYGLKDE
jgi:hypothetical protein